MDESNEGLLLIGTTAIILVAFLIAIFSVMLIYRKRKIEHEQDLRSLHERFDKELLKAQIESQQETMQHIGREIHDNVGHKLTLAFLYTQQLEQPESPDGQIIENVAGIINDSLAELRSLSSNLISHDFDNSSLIELVEKECEKVKSGKFCEITCKLDDTIPDVTKEAKSFISRILQEVIQNSLKHSKCHTISIDLNRSKGQLVLDINDDGIGFDPEKKSGNGVGLKNMLKRANMIGGQLLLKSVPNQGTSVQLKVPLQSILIE